VKSIAPKMILISSLLTINSYALSYENNLSNTCKDNVSCYKTAIAKLIEKYYILENRVAKLENELLNHELNYIKTVDFSKKITDSNIIVKNKYNGHSKGYIKITISELALRECPSNKCTLKAVAKENMILPLSGKEIRGWLSVIHPSKGELWVYKTYTVQQ